MIQVSLKTLMLLTVVAVTSNAGRLFADAPEIVLPTISEQGNVQQVGYQTNSDIQQTQCITESCGSSQSCSECKQCRTHSRGCKVCKQSIWDRVKSKFSRSRQCDSFGEFNVHCSRCRGLGRYCGQCGQDGRGKDRWWLPNGCGGKGCPPFGRYQMVYPLNPQHCDNRDRNVHAAQGYNVPMSVPLAPVVRHQYNYSWGVPSSRLTPISNYAPTGLQGNGNGYGYPGQTPSGYCPSCQQGAGR